MSKFSHTAKALLTPHRQLTKPLVAHEDHFFRPIEKFPLAWLTDNSPIDKDFCHRFVKGELNEAETRTIGFRDQTSRPALIRRTLLEVAGTVLTCQLALEYGLAANVAGGTHHANSKGGAGYTIINDAAVATHVLLKQNLVQRVLVVDLDVHQGDGTAELGSEGQTLHEKLFTLSVHCDSNYPWPKTAKSTYDVGLPDSIGGDEYMRVLSSVLPRALRDVKPDLVVYNAGVDVHASDRLGRIDLDDADIVRRDRYVIETCTKLHIPLAGVIGGGYDKDVARLGRRHAILHQQAGFIWRKYRMWKRISE